MKQKVLFAINSRKFENILEKELKNQFDFISSAGYREIILDKVQQDNPDIVLINEALPGTKSWLDIIYTIRTTHKNVRIIFMTGRRQPGDIVLSELVSYGVYDIVIGDGIKKSEIIRMLKESQSFDDVSYLLPKRKLDESNTEKAFDVQMKVIEKEVVKYIPTPVAQKSQPIKVETQKKPLAQKLPEQPLPHKEVEKPAPKEVIQAPAPRTVIPLPKKEVVKPVESTLPEPEKVKKASVPKVVPEKKSVKKDVKVDFDPRKSNMKSDTQVIAAPAPMLYPPMSQGVVQSRKIISFVGAVNGVGNTQIALNSAVKLAVNGHRVLFLELNPNFSTIDFSFQLGEYHLGVDKALEAVAAGNTKRIKDSIIEMTAVQARTRNTDVMNKNYKKMPPSLDFMMYSQDYQTLVRKEPVDKTHLKDLCMYLLLQENYDYVIVDSEPLGKDSASVQDIASISSKVFITVTQDIAQIGHVSRHVIDLDKRINLEEKMYYIINKHENCELTSTSISDWLETPIDIVMPEVNKEFINANFLGIPFVLYSRNKPAQQMFELIKNKIIES